MSPENKQVTVMILYVDLKCSCCYNKVRKLLCKFPQIRDQEFDVEKNRVRITVVCCDPERFRDKLCCKGGKVIQSIEIVENPKPESPKPERKPKQEKPPPPADKPKQSEPKQDPPPPADKPKQSEPKQDPPPPSTQTPTQTVCCQECYEGRGGGPCHYGYGRPVTPPPRTRTPTQPACCQECYEGRGGGPCHYGYGRPGSPPPRTPTRTPTACCQECYEGRGGGPCHYGYGRPVPPPPGPCYDGYGYGYCIRGTCYITRCDCLCEENPQGCSIM